jgi:hypothetical protein
MSLVLGGHAAMAQSNRPPTASSDVVQVAQTAGRADAVVANAIRSLNGVQATGAIDQRQQDAPASQVPTSQATPAERKWELEVHGGFSVNGYQDSGSGGLPSTGAVIGGKISLSSLYFGAGAQLFNQSEAGNSGALTVPTIAPVDPVLLSSVLQRQRQGGTLGVRVDRTLGQRFTAEITFDYSPGNLTLTNTALAEIEATRASFTPALEHALSVSSVPSSVTSVATVINRRHVSQMFTTGALMINLRETGKAIPYVTIGGGVALNTGDLPSVTLVGNYQLGAPGQIFGTDAVNLRYSMNGRTYVGTGGAGLKYFITPRRGIRFDGRVQLYPNTIVNLVNATPAIVLRSTGSPFPLINSGALQFSSIAPMNGVSVSATPGATVTGGGLPPGLATFTGTGFLNQVSITAGLFWRF